MARRKESLSTVLEGNPFTSKLIEKWKGDLQSFLNGQIKFSQLRFALDSDGDLIKEYQKRNNANEEKRLHLELLPQPFQGDPRAPVWLLMLNPGYSYVDRYDHLGLCPSCDKKLVAVNRSKHNVFDAGRDKRNALQKRQDLLLQQLRLKRGCKFSLLDKAFDTLQDCSEWKGVGGYRWWRAILFGVSKNDEFLLPKCDVKEGAKSVGSKLFVLECNPYHSHKFDNGVSGFGSGYIKFWKALISWAVKNDKKFIIRGASVSKLLHKYNLGVDSANSVSLSNWQKVYLTMKNLRKRKPVRDQICRVLKQK